MVQGQVLLKGGRAETFPIYFFYIYKLLYPLQNCVIHLKEFFFSCYHNFMNKGHSKLSKNEPENIP